VVVAVLKNLRKNLQRACNAHFVVARGAVIAWTGLLRFMDATAITAESFLTLFAWLIYSSVEMLLSWVVPSINQLGFSISLKHSEPKMQLLNLRP
jgi:hypothetical protein